MDTPSLPRTRSGILGLRVRRRRPMRRVWFPLALALVVGTAGCGHLSHLMPGGSGAERPPAEAFGLGPRASEGGLYQAVLDPGTPLKPRELRAIHAILRDPAGHPVEGATIMVDGGMPEHDHGLPTRPRVTGNAAPGVYEIDGVRFNMGGWWVFRLHIDGPAGVDVVTFHLDL